MDLGFQDMEKIAWAYGYKYFKCDRNCSISEFVNSTLSEDEPLIAEVMVDIEQVYEPKSATKKLEDGTLISPPLEDLAPFLSREELISNMYIKVLE